MLKVVGIAVIQREDHRSARYPSLLQRSEQIPEPFGDRLVGRMAAMDVVDEKAKETIVARNEELDEVAHYPGRSLYGL